MLCHTLSKDLLVWNDDAADLKSYRSTAKSQNKTTFLFRFAASDYYASAWGIVEEGGGPFGIGNALHSGQAYAAQETVFFDFDIIQLTFNKDGVYHVIPVVSSPIDIVNAITPPSILSRDMPDWLRSLIMIVLLILLIIVLLVVFPAVIPLIVKIIAWIFKLIIAVVSFPFKLAGKAVKAGRKK